MTPTEIARLIGYLAGIGLGVYMAVEGIRQADPTLVTSGIGLVTVGGVASVNVPRTGGKYAAD